MLNDFNGDLYRSTNLGDSWTSVLTTSTRFTKITCDVNGNFVALSFFDIYRSANGGSNWDYLGTTIFSGFGIVSNTILS